MSIQQNFSPILQSFPYDQPRAGQRALLEALEANWNRADVFVIVAPTAFGKSAIARTLLGWQYSSSYITPTNMLVDQFLEEFPDVPRLHRLDAYYCEHWQQTCAATRARKKGFCKGCVCGSDLATAKYRRGPGVYNYYTYLAQRLYRDVLIVDEAHNLQRTIADRLAERLWIHDYPELNGATNEEQLLLRLDRLPKRKQQHKKIQHLRDALESDAPLHVVEFTTDWFNGKGTRRGDPEERGCIRLSPVNIQDSASMFWPEKEVQKVILLSATINSVDINELGLSQKRVIYINAQHPIPTEQRPIIPLNTVDLNHSNMRNSIPEIGTEIEAIAQYHAGEKGLIHCTYEMSELLRETIQDPRFMFHDRENKQEVYARFRESDQDVVLVACGMYEGIDLPNDAGRWQVITRTPWQSLGSPAIRHKAEENPDWYNWSTLRDLIQAAGRICRTETDYGITYLLDSKSYHLIYQNTRLVPKWFQDAIQVQE
jgi:Rad3-related DNA helicase